MKPIMSILAVLLGVSFNASGQTRIEGGDGVLTVINSSGVAITPYVPQEPKKIEPFDPGPVFYTATHVPDRTFLNYLAWRDAQRWAVQSPRCCDRHDRSARQHRHGLMRSDSARCRW